jgi:hypothetical protein
MNTRILLLLITGVAAFSSCSIYKTGQTPDDVYYSPARPQADSYVAVKKEKEGTSDNYQTYEQYQDGFRDDRFLRMSIGNPYYLNAYDTYSSFDWRYNSYYDGFNYGFNSPWNSYFAWNNYYNPYCPPLYYGIGYGGAYAYGGAYYGAGTIKTTTSVTPLSRPLTFSVNNYTNTNRPAPRNYSPGSYYNTSQRYNNSNSGGTTRSYYNNSSNNGHPSYAPATNTYTPSRSYTPSSSGSSGGGGGGGSTGGGGGGGGVSRPGRGN